MAIRYEYWRHVLTGDIYAVKLDDARVIGAPDGPSRGA